jgi:hypothetical protein
MCTLNFFNNINELTLKLGRKVMTKILLKTYLTLYFLTKIITWCFFLFLFYFYWIIKLVFNVIVSIHVLFFKFLMHDFSSRNLWSGEKKIIDLKLIFLSKHKKIIKISLRNEIILHKIYLPNFNLKRKILH